MQRAVKDHGFADLSELLGVMYSSYLPVLQQLKIWQPDDVDDAVASYRRLKKRQATHRKIDEDRKETLNRVLIDDRFASTRKFHGHGK